LRHGVRLDSYTSCNFDFIQYVLLPELYLIYDDHVILRNNTATEKLSLHTSPTRRSTPASNTLPLKLQLSCLWNGSNS